MAVVTDSSGKANFVCDEPRCGFTSAGWDTEDQATARGAQHANEHETGELMQELTEFESSVGFVRDTPPAEEDE